MLAWRKTRWHCDTPGCGQGTFTERLPAVKARARLTSRLRTRLGQAVGDDLDAQARAAARRYRVCDRTAARAFTAYADEQLADLDEQQDPVQAAGVDEFRRGAPADRTDPETGEVTRTRSEWLTHLVDLNTGGTLGLAEGRTAAAEEGLLAGHAARLRYLAMDLSATYRSGAPAGVTLIADTSPGETRQRRSGPEAFRRLSYRTEHAHEELGLPGRWPASPDQLPNWSPSTWPPSSACWTPTPTASRSPPSGSPRSTCATCSPCAPPAPRVTPAPSTVRDKLASFYIWCADNDGTPEIKTLANHRQMAAASHQRRPDGLFERESRGA